MPFSAVSTAEPFVGTSDDCWNELIAPAVLMEPTESTERAAQNGCCSEEKLSAWMIWAEPAAVGGQKPAISIVWVGIELEPLMNGSVPLLMIQIAEKQLQTFVQTFVARAPAPQTSP